MTKLPYHTDLRPLDSAGLALKPLDLVLIKDVPSHYWEEPGSETLRHFKDCYGLITYYGPEYPIEPYFYGNPEHPGWVSGDGSVVNVHTRRIVDDKVMSAEFWIPPNRLRRLDYNALIMNIFVEYPWQMRDADGPSDYSFIKKGIQEFEYLSRIMHTPYEALVAAHNAAMAVIETSGDHIKPE